MFESCLVAHTATFDMHLQQKADLKSLYCAAGLTRSTDKCIKQ